MQLLAVALLLLAATIDPRLAEPLHVLADLRDASGQPISEPYGQMPDALHLTLAVRPLPRGAGGVYQPGRRTVTMAEALMGEDPRVIAAGLAHEMHHAGDFDLIAAGQLTA